MTRLLVRLGRLATVATVVLAIGFGWFAADAARIEPLPANADGIVVLAGGEQRVEVGLALLRAGVAPRLLVSGVGPGVTVPDLLEATWPVVGPDATRPPAVGRHAVGSFRPLLLRPDRIALGHAARTTIGNARETAAWTRANDLHRLVVVTAGYHMRRALAELGAAVPDVALEPYAVHPPASARLLLVEYLKLVAVKLHLVPAPGGGTLT